MFKSVARACGSSREIFQNEFKRHISKTSSVPSNECITSRQPHRHVKNTPSKWIRLRKHSNSRALSTVNANVAPQTMSWVSKDESREFMSFFPDIVRDLTEAGRHSDIPEVTKRFAKVLQYNVPNGKKNRGLSVVAAYKMIESPENLNPDNIRLANLLGWCVEMVQSSFLINDDIMDSSETRRGKPCWYTVDGVGMQAINDALMIENGLYSILRKYFSGLHCYVPAMELFHDVIMKTSMGQSLDAMCMIDGKPQLDYFTMSRYSSIVKYKTAYYTFQLPVALAMYLAGQYDPELYRQAKTILLEMGHFFQVQLQSSFLINDDIMDSSETRRGKPCWYTVDGVGMQAINDALMIENGLYSILRKYFSGLHCYVPAMELFHDVFMKTAMGQSLDAMCMIDGKPQLDYFTMSRYNSIAKYKAAYYTFQLPVALAMYLAGQYDPEIHRQAKTIQFEMGHFFQVQDDFLDCFGDPKITGKKGTDIRDGKCSWLAVVALQRVTPTQKEVMVKHYGRPFPESEDAIRNLYEELGLPNTYSIFEEESYNLIRTHIQQISKGLPHKLFFKFMEKIYKREC